MNAATLPELVPPDAEAICHREREPVEDLHTSEGGRGLELMPGARHLERVILRGAAVSRPGTPYQSAVSPTT